MRKILVLRGGALGDFIVTLPALALLRQRWPDARIELAGNARAAEIARRRGLLAAVHSQHEARWAPLYAKGPLPRDFNAWLADFDLVINYWPDPDRAIAGRFPLRAGQQFLTATATPTCAPAAAHYCAPLGALGLATTNYFCRLEAGRIILNPPPRPRRTSGRHLEGNAPHPIAIHPGSGSPRKNWPSENWLALWAEMPPPISLVLGEAELELKWARALLDDARGSRPAAPLLLLHPPLENLIAHFAGCRLFLGHDSGVSHLAAACGVPSVLLFGPTDPAMWAPPAPHVRIIRRGESMTAIAVADVRAAVTGALADQT